MTPFASGAVSAAGAPRQRSMCRRLPAPHLGRAAAIAAAASGRNACWFDSTRITIPFLGSSPLFDLSPATRMLLRSNHGLSLGPQPHCHTNDSA